MHLENMFAQDAVRCSDDYNEYFVEEFDCFCEYMDDAERLFPFLKNPAFEEEKEIRYYFTPKKDISNSKGISIPILPDVMIDEIILSPYIESKAQDILKQIISEKYDINVTSSKIELKL